MISIEYALNTILNETNVLECECVDILSSIDKVLADDIYADDDLPPFDKSAMDGYAIKSQDTSCNGAKFKVVGTIKAGDYFDGTLDNFCTMKIMTGAHLPNGADAVIEIERVKNTEDIVFVDDVVEHQNHVIKKGEEIKKGDLALKKSSVIRPCEIGYLASLGHERVNVYKSPTVAILITGDELIPIASKLENGKIRNSNEYSLQALIKKSGAKILNMGIVKDDKEVLKTAILSAFENADIVITSGGASVGATK